MISLVMLLNRDREQGGSSNRKKNEEKEFTNAFQSTPADMLVGRGARPALGLLLKQGVNEGRNRRSRRKNYKKSKD